MSELKILEGFSRSVFTTDLVDEFMEGDYDYLALGDYTFGTTVYDRKTTPGVFIVRFLISKRIDSEDMKRMVNYIYPGKYSMTEMKELTTKAFIYEEGKKEQPIVSVSLQRTIESHIDELRNKNKVIAKLIIPFGIRAQTNYDYYYEGYGRHHVLPVTHIEVEPLCINGTFV